MDLLIIGIAVVATFIIIPLIIVRRIVKNSSSTQDLTWLKQHGKRVIAQVTDVKAEQGWKYEDRYQWNAWEGRYEQARTWRTFYDITAMSTEPQTKLSHTFGFKVWADDLVSKPDLSSSVPVIFDPRNPERYYVDLKVS